MDIDETDTQILEILSLDGRISASDIAKKLGLSTSTVTRKIKRLENEGAIRGFVCIIEDELIGKKSRAVLLMKLTGVVDSDNIIDTITQDPNICNVYETMGNYDLILTACSVNEANIYEMIKQLRAMKGVLWVDFASIVARKKVMKKILS